jgi:hypothetical protein
MRMHTSTALALNLALAAAPASALAGEAAPATAAPVSEGEDVAKPDPTASELFLLGVGVTYGRAPGVPGRSAFLKRADDGAKLAPAVAFEWHLLDRLWLTTSASGGREDKGSLVLTQKTIVLGDRTYGIEELTEETSYVSAGVGLRWVMLRSAAASLSLTGRCEAEWASTDYDAPVTNALVDELLETYTEAGGTDAPISALRGTSSSFGIAGVAGLSAEHWFGPGFGLRLAVDLIESRYEESTGTGPLAVGERGSSDVHFDPKASALVTMAF